MSLAGTVRSAVATADKIVKSLEENVSHQAWTGTGGDLFGKSGFATAVTRKAIVEQVIKERRLPDGRTVLTSAKLTFLAVIPPNGTAGRQEPIDPRDKLTLADGTTGPILNITGLRDPEKSRPYLVEVWLGL